MTNYKIGISLPILLFLSFNTLAQRTIIPDTNISFELPNNWVAENVDGQLFMASTVEEGIILFSAIQIAAGEGISDLQNEKIEENSIVLSPTNYQPMGGNRAAIDYTGDMFGIEIEGYAQIATTENTNWAAFALFFCEKGGLAERHKTTIQQMVTTLEFPSVSTPASRNNSAPVNNTNSASSYTPLHGAKLYYSNSDGNSVTEKNINLCPNGAFTRTGYSNTSYGGMGYSEMDLRGHGRWEAIPFQTNAYKLILHWADGARGELIIEPDGNAFFVTNRNGWHVMTNQAICN